LVIIAVLGLEVAELKEEDMPLCTFFLTHSSSLTHLCYNSSIIAYI